MQTSDSGESHGGKYRINRISPRPLPVTHHENAARSDKPRHSANACNRHSAARWELRSRTVARIRGRSSGHSFGSSPFMSKLSDTETVPVSYAGSSPAGHHPRPLFSLLLFHSTLGRITQCVELSRQTVSRPDALRRHQRGCAHQEPSCS